jgi:putative transposase
VCAVPMRTAVAIDWIVYAKRRFAGPEQVLAYLGRCTRRVALSNDRLVHHRNGRVRFRWKDYADHDRVKVMTLEVDEFLRRFLLHVVPRGFMRIRHFGLATSPAVRCAVRVGCTTTGHSPITPRPPYNPHSCVDAVSHAASPNRVCPHWARAGASSRSSWQCG